MSAAEIVFAALALLALGAGGTAILGGPPARSAGLVRLALAAAGALALFAAPAAAVIAAAVLGAAALVVRIAGGEAAAAEEARPGRGRALGAAIVLGGLAFVLVGTWARQFVWTGRPPAPGFGGLPALAGALGGSPALVLVGLVIVVAAAACAGPPRHKL